MNAAEILLERKLYKEKLDKGEVTEAEQTIAKSWVPYSVFSFAELEKVQAAQEYSHKISEMYYDFIVIGENILMAFPESAGEKLIALTKEFTNRMRMYQDKLTSGNVALFKGMDDQLYWAGVPTNKFQDREKDIFSDASHRVLVKELTEGKVEYPDLFIWHREPAVGKATWVDYDERGFLIAGGVVYKEYEDLVVNLISNANEPIGMSQQMYVKDVVRNEDGVIMKYYPFEFTFLPHKHACNELTAFTLNEDN